MVLVQGIGHMVKVLFQHLAGAKIAPPIGHALQRELDSWQPERTLVHSVDGGLLHVAPEAEEELGNGLAFLLRGRKDACHSRHVIVIAQGLKAHAPSGGGPKVLAHGRVGRVPDDQPDSGLKSLHSLWQCGAAGDCRGTGAPEIEVSPPSDKEGSKLHPGSPRGVMLNVPGLDVRQEAPDVLVESLATSHIRANDRGVVELEGSAILFIAPGKALGDEVPLGDLLSHDGMVLRIVLGGAHTSSLEMRLHNNLVDVLHEANVPLLPAAVDLPKFAQPVRMGVNLSLFGDAIHAIIAFPVPLGGDLLLHVNVLGMAFDPRRSNAGQLPWFEGMHRGATDEPPSSPDDGNVIHTDVNGERREGSAKHGTKLRLGAGGAGARDGAKSLTLLSLA